MASTNKTSHYNLSQYIGSDKPTYLVDYNTDMNNIDTGIYNAQTTATSAAGSVGDISNLETTDKTNVIKKPKYHIENTFGITFLYRLYRNQSKKF